MNDLISIDDITVSATGIDAARDITEEEWETLADNVGELESGRSWILGDLYNLMPNGQGRWSEDNRKAECQRRGLHYGTMRTYGMVCGQFNLSSRLDKLKFEHYRALAIDALDDRQRQVLIEQAKEESLSVAKLKAARDELLGRTKPEKPSIETDATDAFIDNVIEKLPEKTPNVVRTAVKREIKKAADQMNKEFTKAVINETAKSLPEIRERLEEKEKKADEMVDRYTNLYKKVDGILTREEFRFVRGVLHPDRAPQDRREDFAKAFHLFNRLEEAVHKWR